MQLAAPARLPLLLLLGSTLNFLTTAFNVLSQAFHGVACGEPKYEEQDAE
jgi:hypothetical protein